MIDLIVAITINRYPYFAVAAMLSLLFGTVVAPIMIAANTIIHNVSDNEMMGKVFSSLEIVMHLGFLIFMFASSILAEKFSHIGILIIVGGLISVFGAVNFIINRKVPWLD